MSVKKSNKFPIQYTLIPYIFQQLLTMSNKHRLINHLKTLKKLVTIKISVFEFTI